MRHSWQISVSFLAIGLLPMWTLAEQVGTAFTYQGQLRDDGVPVTETCDFEFRLFDAESTPPGSQVGPTLTFDGGGTNQPPITIDNGLFGVALDFGGDVLNGDARWLQIDVCCPSPCATEFTPLSPRQELTGTPYAIQTRGFFVDGEGNVTFNTLSTAQGTISIVSIGGIELIIDADTNNIGEDQNARLVLRQDGGQVQGRVGYRDGTNALEIMQAYEDSLILGTDDVDRLTITSDGNVGIGTSAPEHVLHVTGSDARTIFGQNTFITGVAGYFEATSALFGTGVYGVGPTGVRGESSSIAAGIGVFGEATHTTGLNTGVYGESASTSGRGVFGRASSTVGINYGVYGETASIAGATVFGTATATAGVNYGMYGRSDSNLGRGVFGYSAADTGLTYGVRGVAVRVRNKITDVDLEDFR